jgi:hypothetical protein
VLHDGDDGDVVLQLGRRQTVSRPTEGERAGLRAHFDQYMWVRLPRLLEPALLEEVQHLLERATFERFVHTEVDPPSVDLIMTPGPASALLELLVNDPGVYHDIEAITGCDPVSHFIAQLYRLTPALEHAHQWHSDLIGRRMIALSINLGPGDYEGGVLELRDRASGRVVGAAPNPTPGDAVIFALDPSLQHRVTRVTSGVKTAFAGWFCAGPRTYFDVLRSGIS